MSSSILRSQNSSSQKCHRQISRPQNDKTHAIYAWKLSPTICSPFRSVRHKSVVFHFTKSNFFASKFSKSNCFPSKFFKVKLFPLKIFQSQIVSPSILRRQNFSSLRFCKCTKFFSLLHNHFVNYAIDFPITKQIYF